MIDMLIFHILCEQCLLFCFRKFIPTASITLLLGLFTVLTVVPPFLISQNPYIERLLSASLSVTILVHASRISHIPADGILSLSPTTFLASVLLVVIYFHATFNAPITQILNPKVNSFLGLKFLAGIPQSIMVALCQGWAVRIGIELPGRSIRMTHEATEELKGKFIWVGNLNLIASFFVVPVLAGYGWLRDFTGL
jgi:hypothetical protein